VEPLVSPDHPCQPANPERLARLVAHGYAEVDHLEEQLAASARKRVFERAGFSVVIERDSRGGWIILVASDGV
jgi:hypothetical protein